MDNLDDSENNAKISDSAYSNSCSNSQSRRSHSSKSTHSGSHSSGSSGYGGKPSTSGSSNQPPEKRLKEKDSKKKKQTQVSVDTLAVQTRPEVEFRPPEPAPVFVTPLEEKHDVAQTPTPLHAQTENAAEKMEVITVDRGGASEEISPGNVSSATSVNYVTSKPTSSFCSEGFSCVISMHDGIVMYTTPSLTTTLGFPQDMWVGRSFIDFIHPRDRNIFASQITNALAIPKIVNGTQEKVESSNNSVSTMVCRIRRYRGLNGGFGVRERVVTFMPFLLKLTFKNISEDSGKVIYLVTQATPFYSAFKVPNEILTNSVPFVMRHAANGHIEYLDPESVPYFGYLPQDLTDKDALQLCHPGDLGYLRHVYETIVKEGGMPRCKPYRMMTQNGDFLKLETEWTSFINPWSRKLEFVVGKHYIIEGPSNPDVFQTPEPDIEFKMTEEERNKAQQLRDNIVRVLTEVLTKPAEEAKQQMSQRCQELATIMENLMEEPPKVFDEFRVDLQDRDHSYYERDSVMLGGISPHHDHSDSKSSTATPLSYNQLNYNETLQRYFDSHQPHQYVDYGMTFGQSTACKDSNVVTSCLSPMAQNSGDSADITSSCDSCTLIPRSPQNLGDYQRCRLTESIIGKHNNEMEKELLKIHRENRSTKSEREKVSNETRKKKKEHLARCNASFQPTTAGDASTSADRINKPQAHGVKRSKQHFQDSANKHHCNSLRTLRPRHTSAAPAQPSTSALTTTVAPSHWSSNAMNNMNTFIVGVGVPQQMSIMSPTFPQQMTTMPGMIPMYYTQAAAPAPIQPIQPMPVIPSTSSNCDTAAQGSFQAPPMSCMVYGQAIYGSPFVYSPIHPQMSYPVQQTTMTQSMQYTNTMQPLELANSNYEEACKPIMHLRTTKVGSRKDKKKTESQRASKKEQASGEITSSNKDLNRRTETMPDSGTPTVAKTKSSQRNEETVDKTDGESSYSSFYSSFFKTESGSAEESGEGKKINMFRTWDKNCVNNEKQSSSEAAPSVYEPQPPQQPSRRKMEPPWLEQVCVTSELVYKYQIRAKSVEEVLTADKQKLSNIVQPPLVNEQLNQLYLDLQLEGVAARLTLEEGITSSSSSGEEASVRIVKIPRRKREYSRLVMIYEEDAPLPSPEAEAAVEAEAEAEAEAITDVPTS